MYLTRFFCFIALYFSGKASPHPVHDETKKIGSTPVPHPVHDEWKGFGSTPSLHPVDATTKKKMAIYIKSTTLKLEKKIETC